MESGRGGVKERERCGDRWRHRRRYAQQQGIATRFFFPFFPPTIRDQPIDPPIDAF